MTQRAGHFDDFVMTSGTLAGPLQSKLRAMREAGFTQVVLDAADVAAHPGGLSGAARCLRDAGLRATALQWLRDFEGLSGRQHELKLGVARSMLQMAQALGAPTLRVAASCAAVAATDVETLARDLRKLALLAVPLKLRIAYEGTSDSRSVRDFSAAWDLVCLADMPNLGLAIDSVHSLATGTPADELELVEADRVFLVSLADVMQPVTAGGAAPSQRVFPGEGQHGEQVAGLVLRLAQQGYRGDYALQVHGDDERQLPADMVAQRARAAAQWLGEDVLRRSVPLPGRMRLRSAAG